MARIPQEEIERLKREIPIERLVEAQGIKLERRGQDLVGLCPWHNDKGPSLVITPAKNLWHCMGACGIGGSVIDWVLKTRGVSFRHAIEILRSGQIPAGPARPVKGTRVRTLPAPVDLTADDRALLGQVARYYHETLKQSPEAIAYLAARGITSAAIIERFQIGFANRTLGLRLAQRNSSAGFSIRTRLQTLGVFRKSGHEHFTGSLVIPVLGERGEVLEMYGRKIRPDLRPGTPLHMYLPGPHKGVFNIEALARYPEIILCEALIDALTFLEAGFPNVTASYGANGFTPDHWEAIRRYKTRRVLIAYDRDDAGENGASTLAAELMAAGVECFRVQFPRGMDANAYALKVRPAAKSLGLVIRAAVWMGKGPAPSRGEEHPMVPLAPIALFAPTASPAPPAASVPEEPVQTPAEAPATSSGPSQPPPAAAQATEAPAESRPQSAPVEPDPAPVPSPAPPPDADAGAVEAPPPCSPASPPAPLAPPSSPVPPAPAAGLSIERKGKDLRIVLDDREYRVRGLTAMGPLKIDLMVTRGEHFHQDKFDLALARQRVAFTHEAAHELGVADEIIKKDLGRILLALGALQDEQQKAAQEVKQSEVKVPPAEREEALELLRDPRLLERILEDFQRGGVVGEETNKLAGYLAGVSRKLESPLAVVIQSSSAAGKSSLMEAILSFIPSEDRVKYSAMTGQSLFYMGEADLKHKVLAIVEEEGAERASYALKLLQSEGELTIASTGKDPATGRHVTHEYHVEGPVMIFLTTTAVEIDEELLNRCVVLSVNEDREQTRVIHQLQRERETLAGLLTRRDASRITKRHQNAQRLLRPLIVANSYAPQLTFRDDQTRMRRDHGKYLTLIRALALLHQYQRPVYATVHEGQRVEYIDVTREDIRVANRLAHEVLGRTLDELPPQARRLLTQLDGWVGKECGRLGMQRCDFRFQRKHVRELTGWRETQARTHLERLVELEYVVVHRGARGQSFVYELVYDGQGKDGQPFLMGLIDPDVLPPRGTYDRKFAGSNPEFAGSEGQFAGSSRPHRGPIAAGSRVVLNAPSAAPDEGLRGEVAENAKNAVLDTSASRTTTTGGDGHTSVIPSEPEGGA